MNTAPQPVSIHENRAVNGMALSDASLFEETVTAARELRQRQAEYRKSLPTDPAEAINLALRHLEYDHGDYPEGIEDALHLSSALADLMLVACDKEMGWDPTAAKYIAERMETAMRKAVAALDRANDILRNPANAARDCGEV
ncbi:hypothetical protein SAMN04488527_12914 [Aliiroseovarius crassostreae]|uniref:Uncharacterized protein n=1 Tax=Aliiroseovarius crassostreae TaxID=154981 RepID=A0A0P7KJI4_9RHOB|nr:hypothetical protein [Aliiroseovarius crassostreae]KPN62088.1 hypothetical protein AKJ29_07325 [Aliiroseovarius crassostreae]SFU89135.1 hypothetical protein SAMN04488527_12914 [Aliiroseovarius crassostreae]